MLNKRWVAPVCVVAGLVSLALFLAACDGGGDDGTPTATEPAPTAATSPTPAEPTIVDVFHTEWELIPSVNTAPAGEVIFNATNDGVVTHNFRLARTDLPDDGLPVNPDTFMVREEELEIIARTTKDLSPGELEEVAVNLPPGRYVIFCNVAGHYEAGLHSEFIVE